MKVKYIVLISSLEQLGRSVSLNHNIYTAADPTPVDVVHAALLGGPTMFTQQIMTNHQFSFACTKL